MMKILKSAVVSFLVLAIPLVLLLASGCTIRSISNPGYLGGAYGPYYGGGGNPLYRGELSEFEVLGIERDPQITEDQIGKALDTAKPVRIKRGGSILLVQSGASFPDEPMIQELTKFFKVTPFSGVPETQGRGSEIRTLGSYAKALRLAAARGGHETIVCYWGILESAQKNLATKTVSWVPILGWTVPDETQRTRIRLKLAVIEVRTGEWSILYPTPFEDKAASGLYTREKTDQSQVLALKEKAYIAAAQDLVKICAN